MLLPERVARGLVVGKFCPLHLGHERLIEFAATRCRQLLVIGWSQPGFPGYSAERRERWLRARFPQATVAVLDASSSTCRSGEWWEKNALTDCRLIFA